MDISLPAILLVKASSVLALAPEIMSIVRAKLPISEIIFDPFLIQFVCISKYYCLFECDIFLLRALSTNNHLISLLASLHSFSFGPFKPTVFQCNSPGYIHHYLPVQYCYYADTTRGVKGPPNLFAWSFGPNTWRNFNVKHTHNFFRCSNYRRYHLAWHVFLLVRALEIRYPYMFRKAPQARLKLSQNRL